MQASADLRSLVPAQQELALGFNVRAMDQDWHLPHGYKVGEVFIRVETRRTGAPGDLIKAPMRVKNEVYHFLTNLTHVHSNYL